MYSSELEYDKTRTGRVKNVFQNQVKKYAPTDCFFGVIAHWVTTSTMFGFF